MTGKGPHALLSRLVALFAGLVTTVLLATALSATAASAAEGRSTRVAMTLDCVNMTEQARAYAVHNNLCTPDGKAVESGVSTYGVVTGNCGSSWIWIYNSNGGYARFVYGYHSTRGTVVAHVLRVSWYNWSTGGASGWTDAAGRLSSTYEIQRTRFTGAGYVATGLSGFVTLWWGGTCNILNPTDAVTVRP
jgi:hypothetical protein